MCQQDRMDMLKRLSFLNSEDVDKEYIDVFTDYIPDHYDEIYSLYNLLQEASLNYTEINFLKPICKNGTFIFVCDMSDDYISTLNDVLQDRKFIVSYMRNSKFNVDIAYNKNTHIKFKNA